MSDIKSVLSLLCQHLNLSANVTMKPEHFRLAKFNGAAEIVVSVLRAILHNLYTLRVRTILKTIILIDDLSPVLD